MLGPALRQLLSDLERVADRSDYEERLYQELARLNVVSDLMVWTRSVTIPRRWGVWAEHSAPINAAANALGINEDLLLSLAQLDRTVSVRRGIPDDWHFGIWRDPGGPAPSRMNPFGVYVHGGHVVQAQAISMAADIWPREESDSPMSRTPQEVNRLYCPEPNCPNKGL